MSVIVLNNVDEPNRRYAEVRLAIVQQRLAWFCLAGREESAPTVDEIDSRIGLLEQEARQIAAELDGSPSLDHLCEGLGLSTFERDLLLLCLGIELDPQLAQLCATAHGAAHMSWPTFRLAMAFLPDAHWTALTPGGPLRRWRLIEVDRGEALTTNPLRIDERVLHFILGSEYLDDRLSHFVELVGVESALPGSYRQHLEQIASLWSDRDEHWPPIHLAGEARTGKRNLASAGCANLGLRLHLLRASDIPAAAQERETLLRLWQRESLLLRSALLVECDDVDDPNVLRHARAFVKRIKGPVLTAGKGLSGSADAAVTTIEIERPTLEEQRTIWEHSLGAAAASLNGQLEQIVSQFQFDIDGIQSTGAIAQNLARINQTADLSSTLWKICRSHSRDSLNGLAECIEARAHWEDLVLPDEQHQTLREIAAQVRQRLKVYETWGFGARTARGLGISALFSGPSGTGKTLAAEVIAHHLQLDLYRIDLSQVVSKYIGETEKNLRAVFDAAEESGAVLLFDEADALFGKRSEVRDSHDRYANIEVSYLLQRMESYRGLAILTTNLRGALDGAFLRRIRFIVSFPFPDTELRARIWSHIFPDETPTRELDFNKLARLNVTGGNIRNIAINAAFLAADLGEPVTMTHLLRTARSECLKIEKQTTAAELGGWV